MHPEHITYIFFNNKRYDTFINWRWVKLSTFLWTSVILISIQYDIILISFLFAVRLVSRIYSSLLCIYLSHLVTKKLNWQRYSLIRIFRSRIHDIPDRRQLVPGTPDLYMENRSGARTYNETKINRAHTRVRVRKRALQNGAQGDRRSVWKQKREARIFDKNAHTCATIERNRSSRDDLSRRVASDDPGPHGRESPRTRPRTRWERQKKGEVWGGEKERGSMVASLRPTRVIIGQIAMRTNEL